MNFYITAGNVRYKRAFQNSSQRILSHSSWTSSAHSYNSKQVFFHFSRVISTLSRVISTLSRVISTLSRVISTLSRVVTLVTPRYERDEVVRAVGKEMGFTNPFVTVSHHRAKRELLKLDEAFFKRQFKVSVHIQSFLFQRLSSIIYD